MQLSNNFNLAEFEVSATALRRGIDNSIPPEFIRNAQLLVTNILQPVRNRFGPVVITSGYRCTDLNKAVKGSKTSQHRKAEAADFKVPGVSHREVCEWIVQNCQFDQLIYEYGEHGWIHVSFSHKNNRHDVRSKVAGIKGYPKGLV